MNRFHADRLACGVAMSSPARLAFAALCLLWPVAAHGFQSDEAWIGNLEKDPKLVGQRLTIEGRVNAKFGGDRIALKNSSVQFQLERDLASRWPNSARHVRLEGTLNLAGGKLVFLVRQVTELPSDADRHRAEAGQLKPTVAAGWYDLADRTERLAKFYDDAELRSLAQSARQTGFQAEIAAVNSNQSAELLALADRAAQFGLTDDAVRAMRHRALCWRLAALRKQSPTAVDWLNFAKEVTRRLPGASVAVTAESIREVERYRSNPHTMYESEPASRPVFERILWGDAMVEYFVRESSAAGANLYQWADRASAELPDYPHVGREYLTRAAEADAKRVGELPAARVRELAQLFRDRLQNEARAQEMLRSWLSGRRSELPPRDADGRVRLAQDYLADLRDRSAAAGLYIEALQLAPTSQSARDALVELGYRETATGWVQNAPETPSKAAAPVTGPPRNGMTPTQVLQAMGSEPDRIARVGAGSQLVEQWIYKGPPAIYINFISSAGSGARVVQVRTIAASTPQP